MTMWSCVLIHRDLHKHICKTLLEQKYTLSSKTQKYDKEKHIVTDVIIDN